MQIDALFFTSLALDILEIKDICWSIIFGFECSVEELEILLLTEEAERVLSVCKT